MNFELKTLFPNELENSETIQVMISEFWVGVTLLYFL